jgi:YbgC/YbaW family acyl-CoA thioester hydrolase
MPLKSENIIAWGECDAAGIVYYPRYFNFMDEAFQALMRKAGFSHHRLRNEFKVSVPIVDTAAKFISPASFEDKLVVEADIAHWGSKSFRVNYRGSRDGVPVFEGHEVRVWAAISSAGDITTAAIAPEFRAAMTTAAAGR